MTNKIMILSALPVTSPHVALNCNVDINVAYEKRYEYTEFCGKYLPVHVASSKDELKNKHNDHHKSTFTCELTENNCQH